MRAPSNRRVDPRANVLRTGDAPALFPIAPEPKSPPRPHVEVPEDWDGDDDDMQPPPAAA